MRPGLAYLPRVSESGNYFSPMSLSLEGWAIPKGHGTQKALPAGMLDLLDGL